MWCATSRRSPDYSSTGSSGCSSSHCETSPYAHVDGSTAYYAENSGSFTVEAQASDATSGLASIIFPTTTSAGTTYTGLNGDTTATRSRVYYFTESSAFEGTAAITATDRAGNEGYAEFTLVRDAISPTLSLQAAVDAESGEVTATWDGSSDTDSGIAYYDLDVQVNGGPWQRVLTQTQATSYQTPAQPGDLHTFPSASLRASRLSATDNGLC